MTKRILALALVLGLLCALAGAVYAEETEDPEAPEIITYTGTGDDVIEIDLQEGYAMHITGGGDGVYFRVVSYTEGGTMLDVLAVLVGAYDGILFDGHFETALLKIETKSDWQIELIPLTELPTIRAGETFSGCGDMVVPVDVPGRVAAIKGNADAKYFGVQAFDENGYDLVVNTTSPFDGIEILKAEPLLLVVKATGDWSITLADPH